MSYTNGLDKPTDYFNTKLYTGNGSTGHAITGVGFQPDWVWLKNRDATNPHSLHDSVRGSSKYLTSNGTDAEATSTNRIESFDSDGFTLGSDGNINYNNENFASWNWLAGGSASSNSNGSITSSVSANNTAGFSIVKWTGTGSTSTVGHGLGSTPKMMILRNLSAVKNWVVYHHILGNAQHVRRNTTDASTSGLSNFNSTSPTSSVFTVGDSSNTNPSGQNMIAYCFAEKKGYSKFEKYIGNGNVDGTFVYTGFKPAMIIIKKNGAGDNWHIYDNKVNPTNVMDTNLRPNISDAEITNANHNLDFVSNGFKWRTTSNTRQGSGSEVIYMAFAESPLVTSTGIPTTAR